MFHRRLALMGVLMAAGLAAPALQTARLTLALGEDLRGRAESRLETTRYIPTVRGAIKDRKGRVLAADRPSYDVAVEYAVISGEWAFGEAARSARRAAGASAWAGMTPTQREERIAQHVGVYQTALTEAWRHLSLLTGVDPEEIERRRNEVIRSVQTTEALIRERERRGLERERRSAAWAEGAGVDEVEASSGEVRVRIRERDQAHVIVRGISDEAAFRLIEVAALSRPGGEGVRVIPGLSVVDGTVREYPGDRMTVEVDRRGFPGGLRSEEPLRMEVRGLATHVVGWMRSAIYAEDLRLREDPATGRPAQARVDVPTRWRVGDQERVDLGFYRQGDWVGALGIERSAEGRLRGERGVTRERLDTGEVSVRGARAGVDVPLTIDLALQARVQALLDPRVGLAVVQPWHQNKAEVPDPWSTDPDPRKRRKVIDLGTALSAAVVVLEIDTGEVLAVVSSPTMSHEELVGMEAEEVKRLVEDPVGSPLKNRAVAEAYPPGSIVKPLIYAAAVTSGVIDPRARIACRGMLYPEKPEAFRCWVFKQFQTTHSDQFGGDLDASDALMVSCNVFFYTLGRSMGPARIVEWYGRFGVGGGDEVRRASLGIGRQFTGLAGNRGGIEATTTDEATLMGMGQGPVAWTPMHAADAYATLARGGVRIVPRLRGDEPPVVEEIGLDRRAIPVLLEGLRRAVEDERGSAHHVTIVDEEGRSRREKTFNVPGVVVWGKTGTADAPAAVFRDPQGGVDRRVVLRDGDHSWCVALAGPAGVEARPRYAIAAVVEYGGSGGRVAGPLVNEVIRALAAEGYLPGSGGGEAATGGARRDGEGRAN